VPRRDTLRQKMKEQGISDYRLERGRRVNLFALLRSLGVDNPKQTLTRFVHDEIKTSKTIQEAAEASTQAGVSLGPWFEPGVLGFVNRSGFPLRLSEEQVRGNATIEWRRLNGDSTGLPVTVNNGGVYEVSVSNIQNSQTLGGPRFYVAYKITKA
jgi:hypothetical protein